MRSPRAGARRGRPARGTRALAALALVLVAVPWTSAVLRSARAEAPAQETSAAAVEATVTETIDLRRETQQGADAWADERTALARRYQAAQAAIRQRTERRRLAADRLGGLEERVAELERRLAESARLQTGLEDTLALMLARLEAWVAEDLPFLPEERSLRLALLRDELVRPEVSAADKLRRVLEALQIEAQYGGSAEVYQDRVRVGADSLFVDVLRVGRLSLFWRTPDGRRAGEYDRAAQAWVELPARHRRVIEQAIEMAERRRPVDLIALPLGRIRP